MLNECPCCGSDDFQVEIPCEEIALESSLRTRFALRRTQDDPSDLQDSALFTHNDAADVYACTGCGLLVRGDIDVDFTSVYADESYPDDVLERFLERDIVHFSSEKEEYARLLPAGARVLEVGSYAGGFLHVATSWGWDAIGVDVGRDVTTFANAHGYRTIRGTLENCRFDAESIDGVFIWNCFDQLTDPGATLDEAGRILRAGGLLVIRTPNALFYRLCRPFLGYARQATDGDPAESLIALLMGYNNLLGFPYQFGYAPKHLGILAAKHGFEPVRVASTTLKVQAEDDLARWTIDEQRRMDALLEDLQRALRPIHPEVLASPWVEMIVRKPA